MIDTDTSQMEKYEPRGIDTMREELIKLGYHDFQIREFQSRAKEMLGDEWVTELLREAGRVQDTEDSFKGEGWRIIYKTWDVVSFQVRPEHFPEIAKLLTKWIIVKDNDFTLSYAFTKKLVEFASGDRVSPNQEVIEDLKKYFSLSMEYVRTMEDFSGYDLARRYSMMFDLAKAHLLLNADYAKELAEQLEDNSVFLPSAKEKFTRLLNAVELGNRDQIKNMEFDLQEIKQNTVDLAYENLENKPEPLTTREAIELSVKLYQEDLRYIEEGLRKSHSTYNTDSTQYRAMGIRLNENVSDTPLLMIRPHDAAEHDLDLTIYEEQGLRLEHKPIYRYWFQIAKKNPNSERGRLFWHITKNGLSYSKMSHLYLSLKIEPDSSTINTMESGWNEFNENYPNKRKTTAALGKYGVDRVKSARYSSVSNDVAKMVLEFETQDLIDRYSSRLAKVIPPNKVRQFRNLAGKYIKNPSADKSTYEYQVFKELFDFAGELP